MIILRNGQQRVRCDGCGVMPEKLDQFDAFFISWPAGNHIITQEPLLKYLRTTAQPNIPVMLHSCPLCASKIRAALEVNKLHELPAGPLRKYLMDVVSKPENNFRAFQIHFLKDSTLGRAGA